MGGTGGHTGQDGPATAQAADLVKMPVSPSLSNSQRGRLPFPFPLDLLPPSKPTGPPRTPLLLEAFYLIEKMSFLLPHLHSGYAVDQAILGASETSGDRRATGCCWFVHSLHDAQSLRKVPALPQAQNIAYSSLTMAQLSKLSIIGSTDAFSLRRARMSFIFRRRRTG